MLVPLQSSLSECLFVFSLCELERVCVCVCGFVVRACVGVLACSCIKERRQKVCANKQTAF